MTVSNMTILKARRGDRNGMVNACRFSAKTGGPARTHVLRSGERAGLSRAKVSKIPGDVGYNKNSEE
jgi:hypothetical protein